MVSSVDEASRVRNWHEKFLRAFVAAAESALQGDVRRERRRVELQQRVALIDPGLRRGQLGARIGDPLTDARGRAALQLLRRIDLDAALRRAAPAICARVVACVATSRAALISVSW